MGKGVGTTISHLSLPGLDKKAAVQCKAGPPRSLSTPNSVVDRGPSVSETTLWLLRSAH